VLSGAQERHAATTASIVVVVVHRRRRRRRRRPSSSSIVVVVVHRRRRRRPSLSNCLITNNCCTCPRSSRLQSSDLRGDSKCRSNCGRRGSSEENGSANDDAQRPIPMRKREKVFVVLVNGTMADVPPRRRRRASTTPLHLVRTTSRPMPPHFFVCFPRDMSRTSCRYQRIGAPKQIVAWPDSFQYVVSTFLQHQQDLCGQNHFGTNGDTATTTERCTSLIGRNSGPTIASGLDESPLCMAERVAEEQDADFPAATLRRAFRLQHYEEPSTETCCFASMAYEHHHDLDRGSSVRQTLARFRRCFFWKTLTGAKVLERKSAPTTPTRRAKPAERLPSWMTKALMSRHSYWEGPRIEVGKGSFLLSRVIVFLVKATTAPAAQKVVVGIVVMIHNNTSSDFDAL
jgi:hypothetical protein